MIPELFIVFTLTAPDAPPAFSRDIYVDPISRGEYYLHVEASRSSMHPDYPERIDDGIPDIERLAEGLAQFEVLVNFEPGSLRLAKEEIELTNEHLANATVASYESDKQWIASKNADELLDFYGVEQGTRLPIAHRENSASWLEISHFADGFVDMQINYNQIDGDRVLAIRGRVVSDEVTVEELKIKVDELIAQYKDIPIKRYTGAVVD